MYGFGLGLVLVAVFVFALVFVPLWSLSLSWSGPDFCWLIVLFTIGFWSQSGLVLGFCSSLRLGFLFWFSCIVVFTLVLVFALVWSWCYSLFLSLCWSYLGKTSLRFAQLSSVELKLVC